MASKQNADKPQRKRTQRFNHPCPLAQRVVKKNHVWGSSCHQYLPIRLIHKSEGREHGQESPHSCVMFVGRASRRGRVMVQPKTQHGLCYAKNRVLHQHMFRQLDLLSQIK